MKTLHYVKPNEAIYNCIKGKCNLFKTPFIVLYALGKFSHAILRECTSFYAFTTSNDYFKPFLPWLGLTYVFSACLVFSRTNEIERHCHNLFVRHTIL